MFLCLLILSLQAQFSHCVGDRNARDMTASQTALHYLTARTVIKPLKHEHCLRIFGRLDASLVDKRGITPLCLACGAPDGELVYAILRYAENPNINAKISFGGMIESIVWFLWTI